MGIEVEYETTNQTTPHQPLDVRLGENWYFATREACISGLGDRAYGPPTGGIYCNGTYDGVLCWPTTPASHTAQQHCPPLNGLDPSKYGFRKCGPQGLWEGNSPGDYSKPAGWTNYSECYTPEAKILYEKLFGGKQSSETLKQIAHAAKIIEFVGLTISLMSLLLSIFIFCYFRGLRCHRTRIHRNLFCAISIHIAIQLIVSLDELIGKSTGSEVAGITVAHAGMINNTPILCEILRRVVIEYTKTVMFMWMFIEGMYLHNTLVISVFSGNPNYILYYCLGWGFPVLLTLAWSVPTGLLDKEICWFGYTFRSLYWVIEGPRAAIILVNLGFLLNIIRVLVTKLRDSSSNEALKVRKAVKAAIVLLPLLGVNNSLSLVEPPLHDAIAFGVFQILFTLLVSFQGFFIALLYCFLNGEVQDTLKRYWIDPYIYTSTSRSISTRIASNVRSCSMDSSGYHSTKVKQTVSKHWDRYIMKKQYLPGHSRVDRTESIFYSVTEKEKSPNTSKKLETSQKRESSDSGYHGIKPEHVTLMNGHTCNTANIPNYSDNQVDDCSL